MSFLLSRFLGYVGPRNVALLQGGFQLHRFKVDAVKLLLLDDSRGRTLSLTVQQPRANIESSKRRIAMEMTDKPFSVLRFGVFEADRRLLELRRQGVQVRLQQQPFQILLILLDRAGELVSREQLRRELWPTDTIVDFDRNLNKAMNKLRHTLGDSAENPRFIETLHRKGYRFIAPVRTTPEKTLLASIREEASGRATTELAISTQSSITEALPIERDAEPKRSSWVSRQVGLLSAVGLILILCCSAAVFFYGRLRFARGESPTTVTPRRSVAVLGFQNLSNKADETWLATALSDWLAADLSSGDQLRTLSSENVSRAERELSLAPVDHLSRESLGRIGKILNTDYVVVGAYGLVGNDSDRRIRLDLRLQDTRTGETLATVSEAGTEANLFSLVSIAGERLRGKLGIGRLTPEETNQVAVALPKNYEAARLYSQGLDALHVFDALTASELLRKSISIEPEYALSHAAMAPVWEQLGDDGRAQAEARTALDLSANLPRPERLLVGGRYAEMSKNWDQAINVYRALFEFFPDSLDYGLALAHAQVGGGHGAAGLATLDELRKLPAPLCDDPRIDLAEDWAAESLGDFKRDLSAATRAGEKARTLGASLLLAQALADQEWALQNLGEPDAAAAAGEKSSQIFAQAGDKRGIALEIGAIGIVLLEEGKAAAAKARFQESLAIHQELGSKMAVAAGQNNLGEALMDLGEFNESRRSYERSLETYREIGHEDGVALAKGGLGTLLLAMGKPGEARQDLVESLEICSRLGDRSKASTVMAGLGDVLRTEGDFAAAQKYEERALDGFREIGDRYGIARTELSIAELMMNDGNSVQAGHEARQASLEFKREKAAGDEAVADAILARALLSQGQKGDARSAMSDAVSALTRSDRYEAKLVVAITEALVDANSDDRVANRLAVNSLERTLSQARQTGFVGYEFEARLVSAEIEVREGNTAAARTHLESLKQEAALKGFESIAKQAASILQKAS